MDETFEWQDATTSPSDEGVPATPSTTTSNEPPLFVLPPIAPTPESVLQGPNHLDSDIRLAKRIVSFSLAFLMIGSLAYVGFILVDVGEITGYRPGAGALEAQEVYVDMIQRDQVSLDGSGVTVCIVDSGLNTEHQDLKSLKITKWKDFVGTSSAPYDDHGHGTSMAGLLVADGWMQGIAPKVNLLVAKALAENGSGDDSDVAEAIDWCASNGADIISLSLGGAPGILPFNFGAGRSSAQAAEDAAESGIFVIAAAGNDGGENDDGDVATPCSETSVICVGGVKQSGTHWEGSSVGDNNGRLWPLPILTPRSDPHKKPEIVAPAQSVAVINKEGTWSLSDGTSAATVYVTGAIALLLQNNPELATNGSQGSISNINQVKELIQQSSLPKANQEGHDDNYGYGLLQIKALIEAANPESE
jgi:serine protease AprX|tara:strand:- start:11720 stop:12973 length:1254 start_codon:yes stop_codon:yes gene_type:complete